jgi:arylsulfatase A-like enzyme
MPAFVKGLAMPTRRNILVGLLASLASMIAAPVTAQQSKPNILFILADNIGYGDIGAYGAGTCAGRRHHASINWPPKACG